MSSSPSNEGSQEDTEYNQGVSHKNFKPLQLFHPHGIEGNEEASVQSALPHTSTPVPARSISQSPQTSSSGDINLQNYSRSTVAATYMFSPHDAMNAGSLIDPSPLITRRLDDRNRRRSDGAGDVDAHDDNHPNHGVDMGKSNQGNDDGESLMTPSSSEIGQVELLGEEAHGAEAFLDNENNNTSENHNHDGSGEDHNNDHNSWEQTFQTIRHPISSTKAYFTNLSSIFTWEFLSYLGVVNFCILGGAFTLVMALGLPLFKELGIDASRQQLYMTMIMSPWAMKPFIGVRLIVDCCHSFSLSMISIVMINATLIEIPFPLANEIPVKTSSTFCKNYDCGNLRPKLDNQINTLKFKRRWHPTSSPFEVTTNVTLHFTLSSSDSSDAPSSSSYTNPTRPPTPSPPEPLPYNTWPISSSYALRAFPTKAPH